MEPQTVLVVDDEKSFLDIMKILLSRAGFRVLTSAHGSEGLKMIYDQRPDLVLLDDMLPGMSGCDICAQVKHDDSVQHIPVLLYSAGPRVRDAELIRQIRADGVLYKPFRPPELVKKIASYMPAPA
jgi:DNA-binding response OmpR family regulator